MDKPKHIRSDDCPTIEAIDGVKIKELVGNNISNNLSLAIGVVEPGHKADPHFHEKTEEIYFIVEGEGKAVIGDEVFEVKTDDAIFVPKMIKHGLENTSHKPMKVLAISSPAFNASDFLTKDK